MKNTLRFERQNAVGRIVLANPPYNRFGLRASVARVAANPSRFAIRPGSGGCRRTDNATLTGALIATFPCDAPATLRRVVDGDECGEMTGDRASLVASFADERSLPGTEAARGHPLARSSGWPPPARAKSSGSRGAVPTCLNVARNSLRAISHRRACASLVASFAAAFKSDLHPDSSDDLPDVVRRSRSVRGLGPEELCRLQS